MEYWIPHQFTKDLVTLRKTGGRLLLVGHGNIGHFFLKSANHTLSLSGKILKKVFDLYNQNYTMPLAKKNVEIYFIGCEVFPPALVHQKYGKYIVTKLKLRAQLYKALKAWFPKSTIFQAAFYNKGRVSQGHTTTVVTWNYQTKKIYDKVDVSSLGKPSKYNEYFLEINDVIDQKRNPKFNLAITRP